MTRGGTSVRCLLRMHGDLNLDYYKKPVKNQAMMVLICNSSAGGWRQADPRCLLAGQSSQIDEPRIRGETLSQKIKVGGG